MPSDSDSLWPRLPDAAAPVADEERTIDDVDEPLDEEEPVAGEDEIGIDADERIVVEDDELDR
jgi:hypothetical protein